MYTEYIYLNNLLNCSYISVIWLRFIITDKTINIRYRTIQTKETALIGYHRFLLSPEYDCEKINPLYPIQATSFVSIVKYPTWTLTMLWIILKKSCENSFVCERAYLIFQLQHWSNS
jgi:hypothetical protein